MQFTVRIIRIRHVILITILILSLLLQAFKLDWGLVTDRMEFYGSSAFHIAESSIVNIPLTMIRTGDLNPHHFVEPGLFYNSMYVVFIIASKLTAIQSFTQYIYIARIMTILFSAGTVFLVYLIGKEAGGTTAGLLSALLMAINPYYLWFSAIAKEDPMMVLLVTSAMYLFIGYLKNGNIRYFMLSMALAGLAASTKYPAGMLLPFLILLYFIYSRAVPLMERLKTAAVSLAVYVLAFAAGTPYSILAPNEFLSGASGEFNHYMTSHPGFLHFTWFVHVQTLTGLWDAANIWGKNGYGLGLLLVMAGIVFIASGFRQGFENKKRYIWYMLAGWITLTIFVFFFLIKIKMGNQMMIMTPAAMVVAGFGLDRAISRLPGVPLKIAFGGTVVLLIFTYSASGIVSSQNDNRYYAAEWLTRNADRNASMGSTLFAYVPDEFKNIAFLNTDIALLENASYDYIILSSWEYERYLESPGVYPVESGFYTAVLSGNTKYKPVADFIRTETSRERTLNFGLRALAEKERYRGEVDIHIFRRQ